MKLFGRVWSVQIDRTQLSGFDMTFTVVKTLKPEPNTCELHLYNLSEAERGALEGVPIVAKATKGKAAQHKGIPVRIEAGYEAADSLIWNGDLRTVESTHDGTEWITVLGSGDGEVAYRQSRVNLSFGQGTPIVTVIKALAKALGVGAGNLEFYSTKLALSPKLQQLTQQGVVLSGSAAEQLTQWTRSVGLEWSIQDGSLQFVERGQPTLGQAVLLSQSTGMVGEPTIDNEGLLTVKMLMIPNVLPGTVLVLDSERVKGNFRIQTATYEGDTSGQPWYISATAKAF